MSSPSLRASHRRAHEALPTTLNQHTRRSAQYTFAIAPYPYESMEHDMKETIGWIGVGSMGHRMSRHLVEAGYPVVVADAVSTERAPPGTTMAKSNAEVAKQADVIILSLPDGKVSQAVAKEIAAAPQRRV